MKSTKELKAFEWIKWSKWETSCTSMWIKQPWHTSCIFYSELARTLFPGESTSNIKTRITHYKVTGVGGICEKTSLLNPCWVILPVFHQVLNACSQWWNVYLKVYWKSCVITSERPNKN